MFCIPNFPDVDSWCHHSLGVCLPRGLPWFVQFSQFSSYLILLCLNMTYFLIQITVFWDVTPYNPINVNDLPDYTASHRRRQQSSQWAPWEAQTSHIPWYFVWTSIYSFLRPRDSRFTNAEKGKVICLYISSYRLLEVGWPGGLVRVSLCCSMIIEALWCSELPSEESATFMNKESRKLSGGGAQSSVLAAAPGRCHTDRIIKVPKLDSNTDWSWKSRRTQEELVSQYSGRE
jgi:hypothetical protein